MSDDRPREVLRELLRPLERHYGRPEVEEVAVCGPGLAFRRLRRPDRAGRVWQPAPDPDLTHSYLTGVAHCVANVYRQPFDGDRVPTLSCTVPGGHRFTCVAGNGVTHGEEEPQGGIAMNIRQAPGEREQRSLSDFRLAPAAAAGPPDPLRRIVRRRESSYQGVLDAARSGAPVLISGPTGSGKTSLLNLMLQETDPNDRIVTVEDARELRVRNPNRVHLLLPRDDEGRSESGREEGLTGRRLMDVLMRMTPDTILIGEISTRNAALAREIIGSGHSHCWTTIHAGDPQEAMEAFAKRVLHILPNAGAGEIQAELARKVCVIQTHRAGARRMITEIRMPPGARPAEGPSRMAA